MFPSGQFSDQATLGEITSTIICCGDKKDGKVYTVITEEKHEEISGSFLLAGTYYYPTVPQF
jgi:hypothetical protein